MIFKVLFQEHPDEVPTRERTKSVYLEADSIRDVRQKLQDKRINIEYIQPLTEAHLAYDQQSEDYQLENV
ncbi:MAG TPA: DNA-directed RNA polymerase subunit epsilon [Cerasibacillus sp.]|uniref:DNA-directed RNA polymerase subunit epsilon n=1 Tax=Cerasibacillus sp. TaxID=2498711 RepID=UPI002F421060